MMEMFRGSISPKDWTAAGAIVGLTVVLTLVFIFLIHGAQIDRLEALEAEDLQVRQDRDKAKETEKNIGQLREEKRKMDELVKQFEKRLPEEWQIASLVQQFEGLAKFEDIPTLQGEFKVNVESKGKTTDSRKQTILYSFHVEGSFHQIASYVNRLERFERDVETPTGVERFERFFKISDLNIEEQDEGVCKASFMLETYRFLEEEGGAA